ncbi:MAG: acyl-ACP desaturase [Acidimicrobiales bacterium]
MPISDTAMLEQLIPTAAQLYDRHLSTAKEWFPHAMVPWSRGRDFVEGERWDEDEYPMPDAVRSALYVNLLTEDNLPYYFHTIDNRFGKDPVFVAWNRRWTAEENRHAIVIRDYLTITRALDPVALERARMAQMCAAVVPEPESVPDALSYVALQELATRVSHRNTGKMLEDKTGFDIMARVAADENLHYLFYRDLVTTALELDPSATMCAITRQALEFEMPGVGIVDFAHHAAAIARAGIYDFAIHHEQILVGVILRHWKVESLTGLSDEAEAARDALLIHIDRVGRVGRRFAERRAEALPV